jgi:hypothetical protein
MENTRNILTKKEAENFLTPYLDKIVGAISDAFNDYLKIVESGNYELRKTTIAGLIHDMTRKKIKCLFIDDENIEAKEYNKIFGIKICDKLLIRFKKINDDFSTSNIQTLQTIQYANQLEIEGFPENPTLLYAGYMPDATWTSIKNIYLMCKHGDNLLWQIDLTGSMEQTELNFNNKTEDIEEYIVSRVKVKTKEEKKLKKAI